MERSTCVGNVPLGAARLMDEDFFPAAIDKGENSWEGFEERRDNHEWYSGMLAHLGGRID
jgi:hypothetical protein